MTTRFARRLVFVLVLFIVAGAAANGQDASRKILPNPVLVLVGHEYYETDGKQYTRFKYAVDNLSAFPNELFAASPSLPPCGANTRSSRTWVDIFDARGKRLYGFCALTSRDGLNNIWFSLYRDEIPPSWIYIELNDRLTGAKYRSGLAETTL